MSLDNGDLKKIHGALPELVDQLKAGKLDRRDFLRTSTLLGLSASAAYALAGLSEPVPEARAATGGTIRFSMRVIKIENPPIYDYIYDSNICRQVCDYLTRTGADNVTRPWLLDKWQANDDDIVASWTYERGLPAKISGPQLNAKTGEIAIEELHIAHEGLRLVPVGG